MKEREKAREKRKRDEKKRKKKREAFVSCICFFRQDVHLTITIPVDHSPCRRDHPATRIYFETHSYVDDVWWCVDKICYDFNKTSRSFGWLAI